MFHQPQSDPSTDKEEERRKASSCQRWGENIAVRELLRCVYGSCVESMQMLVNLHVSTNPSDMVISLLTECLLTVHPRPHRIAHFVFEFQHVQSALCWQQPFPLNSIVSHDADCTLLFGNILLHSLSSIYIVFESDAQHCSSAGSIHLTYHTWPLCFYVAPSTGLLSDTALRPRCSRTMLEYVFNLADFNVADVSMSKRQACVDLTSDVEICPAELLAARLRGGGPFRADKLPVRCRAHG